MIIEYPNPWSFSNTDIKLKSPNGVYKAEYRELCEIAMVGPLGGECFLNLGNTKIKISSWCGGPVMWNNLSSKIALPTWTKNRNQKIEILDIEKMEITTYETEFRVLHFLSFVDNLLQGVDSPLHKPSQLYFDLNKEEIENIREIKN